MISKLKRLLQRAGQAGDTGGSREDELQLAVAALLVELARADFAEEPSEEQAIRRLLEEYYELSPEESAVLLGRAQHAADESVSLHEFTRRLHGGLDEAEKRELIRMLWRIALADRRLDKYEDYLISKLADLLYVPRGDVLRLKNQVIEAQLE